MRGIGLNTIVEIGSKIINFTITILITRIFGPKVLGEISSIQAIVGYINLIGDFGSNNEAVRKISANNKSITKTFSTIIIIRVIISITLFAILLYIFFNNKFENYLIFYFALISIFSLFIPNFVFMGLGHFKINAYINLISTVTTIISFLVLLQFYRSIIIYPISLSIGLVISLAISLIVYFKDFGQITLVSKKEIKSFLTKSFFLGLTVVFAKIYYDFDIILLNWMTSKYQVGLYSAAFKIIQILWFVPSLYTTYALPYTTSMLKHNVHMLPNYVNVILRYISFFVFILLVIGILYAGDILSILFGSQFIRGESVLIILLFGFSFMFYKTCFGNLLVAKRQEKFLFNLSIFGSLFNVVVNIFLIPLWGITGAAISTLCTEAFLLTLEYRKMKAQHDIKLPIINIVKMILVSLLIFIICFTFDIPYYIGIPLSTLFYIILLLLIKESTAIEFKKIIVEKFEVAYGSHKY